MLLLRVSSGGPACEPRSQPSASRRLLSHSAASHQGVLSSGQVGGGASQRPAKPVMAKRAAIYAAVKAAAHSA